MLINNRPTVSVLENRVLKERPHLTGQALISGEFFRDYENYYAYTFIFREKLVGLSRGLKTWRGLPTKDGATIVTHQGANVYQQDTSTSGTDDKSKNIQVQGRVLVVEDRGMEIHSYNPEAGRLYAECINEFASKVKDVQVYSMLVPTQIEFVEDLKYRKLSYPQKATIDQVNAAFCPQVQPINVYDILQKHAKEYIYFRTDHHWTALGAYYAYTKFIEAGGENPVPLESYLTDQVEGFLGTTYSTTLSEKLKSNPDKVIYYEPFTPYEYQVYYDDNQPIRQEIIDLEQTKNKNKYGLFLGGDNPWAKITTDNHNKKKILVIKDSYGNAFVPFLLPHYIEIYVLDPREFEQNIYSFVREKDIDEVLFLNYVLVTDNMGFPKLLETMLKR